MNKENNNKKEVPSKRVLGDEWEKWDENSREKNTDTPKKLFLLISLLSLLSLTTALCLVWYFISPRLFLLSTGLAGSVRVIFLIAGILFHIWFMLIFFEILFFRQIPGLAGTHMAFVKIFYALGSQIRKAFRINRDAFANSFVKVSNFLVGTSLSRKVKKTVVLLPRCLQKEVKEQIIALSRIKDIPVHVVGGGEQARKILKKERPDSVIAVACERDLVAGIQDIPQKIAVIGIPNKRPNGPCLNTCIDMEQFERALKTFV